MPSVGIVGFGHVGGTLKKLFPEAAVYDKYIREFSNAQEQIDSSDICFVCVPTPEGLNGEVDLSEVDDVLQWIESDLIVIKSTVPPGTTSKLRSKFGKRLVCSPEYFGESSYTHSWSKDPASWPFVVVGGPRTDTRPVIQLFADVLGPDKVYRQVEPEVAELAKYMENAWLATQVIFAWQFGLLAAAIGTDYWEVREIWALDPRVSRWHTALFSGSAGFGGKCLPKDVAAISAFGRSLGCSVSFLEELLHFNCSLRAGISESDQPVPPGTLPSHASLNSRNRSRAATSDGAV